MNSMSQVMDFDAAKEFSVTKQRELNQMIEEQESNLSVIRQVAEASGLDSLKDTAEKLEQAYKGYNDLIDEMVGSLKTMHSEAEQIEELNRI